MRVENKSITSVEHTTVNLVEIFDFGTLKSRSKAEAIFHIIGENIQNVVTSSPCDCTSATPNYINENTVEIAVKYKNTHRIEPFNKTATVNFMENGVKKKVKINIKGNVVK